MADGLISVICPKLPIDISNLSSENNQYKWVKIYDMREDIGQPINCPWNNNNNNNSGNNELEVVGKIFGFKVEKQITKLFFKEKAASLINKAIRKWIAINKIANIKRDRNIIMIQCMFRCFKARKKVKKLRVEKNSQKRSIGAN